MQYMHIGKIFCMSYLGLSMKLCAITKMLLLYVGKSVVLLFSLFNLQFIMLLAN